MRLSTSLVCLPLLFVSPLVLAATPGPTPMRDFFRNPEKSSFQDLAGRHCRSPTPPPTRTAETCSFRREAAARPCA